MLLERASTISTSGAACGDSEVCFSLNGAPFALRQECVYEHEPEVKADHPGQVHNLGAVDFSYLLQTGDQIHIGEKHPGWFAFEAAGGSWAVGIQPFWEMGPKEVRSDKDGSLTVWLVPSENILRFGRTRAITHDLFFLAGTGTIGQLTDLMHPLVPFVEAGYVGRTKALPYVSPPQAGPFPEYENWFRGGFERWCQKCAEYGVLHYGDWRVGAGSYRTYPSYFGNHEYDTMHILLTQPSIILFTDEAERSACEFYNMLVVPYEGLWLGFLCVAHWDGGVLDIELAHSRDGLKWERLPRRDPVFPLGEEGAFDAYRISLGTPLLRRQDTLMFYYSGCDGSHFNKEFNSAIGLAWWRVDGFVSRRAEAEGQILTRPCVCEGDNLYLNAKTSPGGFVSAEVLSVDTLSGNHLRSSQVVEGMTKEDCEPFSGNALAGALRWKSGKTLASLRGRPIRLKFYLSLADLYAFWLAD